MLAETDSGSAVEGWGLGLVMVGRVGLVVEATFFEEGGMGEGVLFLKGKKEKKKETYVNTPTQASTPSSSSSPLPSPPPHPPPPPHPTTSPAEKPPHPPQSNPSVDATPTNSTTPILPSEQISAPFHPLLRLEVKSYLPKLRDYSMGRRDRDGEIRLNRRGDISLILVGRMWAVNLFGGMMSFGEEEIKWWLRRFRIGVSAKYPVGERV